MSSKVSLPAILVLILAVACVGTETTETVGETAVTSTAEPASEQFVEGAQQVGEGLEKAGRGVAQATGEALQRAGQEIEEAARTGADTPTASPAVAPPPGSADAGGRIYVTKQCAGCHGVNGAGGTAIARKQNIQPLSAPPVQSQSDAELARVLTEGKTSASASAHRSKNLTPEEVRDLIAWIRSL
jgi:mono/diheme cytochrome c family protein